MSVHSITRRALSQNPPIRPYRVNSPVRFPLLILENSRPRKPERYRQLPTPLLIMQPQPDEVPLCHSVVLKGLPPVEDTHVI